MVEHFSLSQPSAPDSPQPLDFLLQIDLSELRGFECARVLPDSGLLTFFYDAEHQPWGYDPKNLDGYRVELFSEDSLVQTIPPRKPPFEARALRFWSAVTVPSVGSLAFDALDQEIELPDAYSDFSMELDCNGYSSTAGVHRLFGHSANVQGDMQTEAQLVSHGLYCGDPSGYEDPRAKELSFGADDWVLLLQLDSEESVSMMWGDCGMLYFWIRKSDLAQRRFDRCWMTLQCG